MNQNIFRKKSIDKINSPESLNDYIRVSNPAVWLILAAVIFLLIGILIWGFFGHIDTTVKSYAVVKNSEAVCSVPKEEITSIKKDMTVIIDGKEGSVIKIGDYDEANDSYNVFVHADVKDGSYSVEFVAERVKPASFVLN